MGAPKSEETKAKIRATMLAKGIQPPPGAAAKGAKARHANGTSTETREKIAASKRGKKRGPQSPEWRSAIGRASSRTWSDPEFHERMKGREPPNKGVPSSPETRAKQSAAATGRPMSPETRARMSAARMGNKYGVGTRLSPEHKAKLLASHLGKKKGPMPEAVKIKLSLATAARLARQGAIRPSLPQTLLMNRLLALGLVVETEKQFGRYVVDCYLPEVHIAVEADGDYWHRRPGAPERDRRRDEYLERVFGLGVIRFWESEIKSWPPLP